MSVEALDNISCPIAPVADSHLANKAYVDAAVASGAGTASGSGDNIVSIPAHSLISCDIEPTEDAHLVNKAYVDAAVAAAGSATPIEEPAALGRVVYVDTLSDAASHTGTSLRDAIEAVTDKGSVVIKFSVSGTITLEQGEIVIPVGNIAIDGEDKITISGGGVSRVFSMTNASALLSLYRLTIRNGNGLGATASMQYGGAVYVVSASLYAKGCTFINNNVTKSGVTVVGGAICLSSQSGSAELVDCVFKSNYASGSSTVQGGAIGGTSGAGLVVSRCRFVSNYTRSTASTGTISGGAIYLTNGLIEDSVFQGNYVAGAAVRYGGAIATGSYRGVIKNCEFTGNEIQGTTGDGGAIHINQLLYTLVTDCIFTENIAQYGGAIGYYGRTSGHMQSSIRRCVFDGNILRSGGRGGAIYANQISVKIEDCEFKNHDIGSSSGVIYCYGYTNSVFQATINRCKLTGNSSSATTTGLVYCANLAQVYIYNSVFTGNSFTATSGNHKCVYTTGSNTWAFIYNCTFTNNDNKGGAFYAAAGGVDIYNSVEYGNGSASGKGTNATVNAAKFLSDQSESVGRDLAYDSTKPLFAADGFTPVANSQVIDKGDDTYAVTEYDLPGKARVSGASVDVGAVEWQSS